MDVKHGYQQIPLKKDFEHLIINHWGQNMEQSMITRRRRFNIELQVEMKLTLAILATDSEV